MKYLRRFNESNTDELIETIKDILLPISDLGYDDISVVNGYTQQLTIRVVSWTDEPLLITDEVKEEFTRMKDYLESEGYNSILTKYWRSNSVLKSEPFDYFINHVEGSISNLLFVAEK